MIGGSEKGDLGELGLFGRRGRKGAKGKDGLEGKLSDYIFISNFRKCVG